MFPDCTAQARLNELALKRMQCGVFSVDREMRVVMWNDFMAERSGLQTENVLGKPLLELFPDLPAAWLKKKFDAVFLLKISTFTSWEHRPYLFQFIHDRPISGGIDWMQQDCSFAPLMEGPDIIAVCVTITDVTDLAIMHRAREEAVIALQEVSIRDGLTGLFNRRHIEELLSSELARRKRSQQRIFSTAPIFTWLPNADSSVSVDTCARTASTKVAFDAASCFSTSITSSGSTTPLATPPVMRF